MGLLSRCCKETVEVQNNSVSYYVCTKCGLSTELVQMKSGGQDVNDGSTNSPKIPVD